MSAVVVHLYYYNLKHQTSIDSGFTVVILEVGDFSVDRPGILEKKWILNIAST